MAKDKNDSKTTMTRHARPAHTGDQRPVRISLQVNFANGNRRVTPADLDLAVEAGVAAMRTALETRNPSYKVHSIEGDVEYLGVVHSNTVRG